MRIYKKSKYDVCGEFHIQDGYIFDDRIYQKIKIDGMYKEKILRVIFASNSVDSIRRCNFDDAEIKRHLEFLEHNDIITIKQMFSKKIVYEKNSIETLIKGFFMFFIRFIPFLLLSTAISTLMYDRSDIYFLDFILIFLSFLLHETGHVLVFLHFNNHINNFYICIDKFSISIITSNLSEDNKRLIAICGPISGSLFSLICFYFNKKNIYYFIAIYHLIMLMPFFDDGKHLWGSKKNQ